MAEAGRKKRVLWLHTQPEHYFNCMMDDLARGSGYQVPGMPDENAGEFEYIAAFSTRGPGWYKDNVPQVARTIFIQPRPGNEGRPPRWWETYHKDWRADLLGLDFDAVIVSGYAFRTHRALIKACGQKGIPVAMWSDSNIRSERGRGFSSRVKRGFKKLLLRNIIRSVDLMLTANTRGVAYWRYFGAPHGRIVLCPCYTDYPRIDAARRTDRGAVLEKFGVSPATKVLFSAARLVPAKGLDLFIPAFLKNLARNNWTYVVAGVGPEEAHLEELAARDRPKPSDAAPDAVRLVGFQQPAENLALMAHAEMLVLPSRYEPHGIVVAEAMAAGTPVLASHVVGAAMDLITPGVNGLIFRAGDADDLNRALDRIKDPAALAAMRQKTRPAFEAWYRRTSPMVVVPRAIRMMLAGKKGNVGAR